MRTFYAQANVLAPAFVAESFSIGPQVVISGGVTFDGEVHIDGHVSGEIRCTSLVVSETGSVDGLIVAYTVTVEGQVTGAIYADCLLLKADCDVEGEIYHEELQLEQGCYFEGKSRRYPRASALAPAAAAR